MAKKYLLYIHPPAFEKEAHKSQLVNGLLENYYQQNPMAYDPIKKTVVDKPIARVLETTEPEYIGGEFNAVHREPYVTVSFDRGSNLCKIHDLPLTFNGKCLQKGCKYA